MKLWRCTAYGTDWDATELKVNANKEEMIEKWAEELNDGYGWYVDMDVEEVTEVDGYRIKVESK